MKNKNKKLPDDTPEIEYGYQNANADTGKITTSLFYDCGCEYKIIWDDIQSGKVYEIVIEDVCEVHDPTLPYVKEDENE